ncbi:MAG: hypothetical protein M1817_002128 [Caeruleum heppii]|nr:MAG: hypothetical protein M1817_002128 [Caeruleum heppii]
MTRAAEVDVPKAEMDDVDYSVLYQVYPNLWGNPKHLDYLATTLRAHFPDPHLHILVARRNAGSFTYDGIELGAERVTHEIEDEIESLRKSGKKVKKLSIVGYSLGGLVARYVIGLLYSAGVFDDIQPVNFTTFATPHLGVRTPNTGFLSHVWNLLGSRTLSRSGRQLFTIDTFRDTSQPLLSVLADPQSIFIRALASFKHRSLYANIINDRTAVYYTTAISRTDPFRDLSNVDINYLSGYEPNIIDFARPTTPKAVSSKPLPFLARLIRSSRLFLSKAPLTLALVLFIPLGAVFFLLTAAVQSVRSMRRIQLHEAGRAGIGIASYRIPLMVEEVRGAVDDAMNEMRPERADFEGPVSSSSSPSPSHTPLDDHSKDPSSPPSSLSPSPSPKPIQSNLPSSSPSSPLPLLPLTPAQITMIHSLDTHAPFEKFPVHIHDVRHSHAGIIVRHAREAFKEGKVVVRHWVERGFEV